MKIFFKKATRTIFYFFSFGLSGMVIFSACSKGGNSPTPPPPTPQVPVVKSIIIDNQDAGSNQLFNISTSPIIRISFTQPIKSSTTSGAIALSDASGVLIPVNISLQNSDSVIQVQPTGSISYLAKFIFTVNTTLESASGARLNIPVAKAFITRIDPTLKFPSISDDSLLTLVQKQTFKYFWDFGHPVSGLAMERNTSGDIVTSGGSGLGIMTIPVGVNRGFITRQEGLMRMQKITDFLKNDAVKVKGAFSHWLNGITGAIVPFSANDNGADLVETSLLMMGLLTARQYFDDPGTAETNLRNDITQLYNDVEWDWFRNGGQDVLYWHYSPDKGWIMNLPIRGWNECLITYVLAASSPTHSIPVSVYNNGWKNSSIFLNGNTYYGTVLPLGPDQGGPLFFEHYSFMGINPNGLSEGGINYTTQAQNHTRINYSYCVANPKNWFGFKDSCWGLTASDIPGGYTASSPTNDVGVIAPTAALSSLPFTPSESMKALKYFYYVLGDKIWKEYGFVDAFKLNDLWFATSYIAIDQGPIIGMIENYRTGLLWNLFTSSPEVKTGMLALGFTAPYL